MAAPVLVAIRALGVADGFIKKHIPGGWVSVIGAAVIIALVIPMMLVNSVAKVFDNSGIATENQCDVNFVGGNSSPEDDEGDGSNSSNGGNTGGGNVKGVAWPTENTSKVVKPINKTFISSRWGARWGIIHNGDDWPAEEGFPIMAAMDGVVAYIDREYSNRIVILHRHNGQKVATAYHHSKPSYVKVKPGQQVKAGEVITNVSNFPGSKGKIVSSRPGGGQHLHFSIFTDGSTFSNGVSPSNWLKANGATTVSDGGTANGNNTPSGIEQPEGVTSCNNDGETGTTMEGDGTTAWGGFKNGEVDPEAIRDVTLGNAKFKIQSEAANDIKELNQEFKKKFSKDIPVIKGYQSLEDQKKDSNVAVEGTSIFGFARVLEINVKPDSEEGKWLVENGAALGWKLPEGAKVYGSSKLVMGYVGSSKMPEAAGGSAKEAQEYARDVIKNKYNWPDSEYVCIVKLWHKESSWNYKAANPTTSARGIVQAMMSIHFGKNWKTDAKAQEFLNSYKLQVDWGLNYIAKHRNYGTPCKAWNHSQRKNWY